MRLIRGAPGTGKTALVFREFKEALRAGRTDLRIVVPTATLVRHFRHELARDGVVFSPGLIVSLSRLAGERAAGLELTPDALLSAIVRECLNRVTLPEFADVAGTEGMVATVLETIALFENAACTPDKLAAVRRLHPLGKAFERVWREVAARQAQTGYRSRMSVVQAAAANPGPAQVWMDGFLGFSPLETELVRNLAASSDLTLTIDDSRATDDIRKLALQLGAKDVPITAAPRKPEITVVEARSLEREADEIARRIVELTRAGVAFRQIGVAIRDTGAYLSRLRTAFDRFRIPARFYFSSPLRSHPAATFLGGLISGAISDWDFETTIETLRAHPKWGRTADFDRFDFAIREAMPGHGAEAFLALCESEWLRAEIATCLKVSAWKTERQTSAGWQSRIERLAASLYRPGTLDAPRDHAAIAVERTHTAALNSWLAAVRSIVPFWPDADRPISLDEFWRIAQAAIDGAVLHPANDRAQAVHVMSVYEARQWDLDVLFVCGMVDRDFPRRHPQNLLFTDAEIDRLHAAGIPLRKVSDLEAQEQWLFESLKTRAASQLFLSYPVQDASGKSAQRSRFIDDLQLTAERAVTCRPAASLEPRRAGETGQIHPPELLTGLAGLHKSISLTALEDLAQCRFKFFGGRTLSLKSAPDRPGERLQPRVTGSILHEALERWLTDKSRDFIELFEKTFDEVCRKQHIPRGYRLEVERIQFREIAEKMSANERWHPSSSDVEVKLALDFPGGVTVNCRIDRIDRFSQFGSDCVIVDYKSSKTARVEQLVESHTRLQGPLYALAVREKLNLNPVAMLYWAVREDELHGWGGIPGTEQVWREIPPNWEIDARTRTVERLTEFLGGAVRAHPEEKENCRWCELANACRVEQPALISISAIGQSAGADSGAAFVKFTEHQEHAIAWRRQDACVVAGPGSGKTTVLVERYRSLISDHNLEPREILAITFTEKAAANMKQKIVDRFKHDPVRRRELESAWISTIHGFCARVLRENAIAAGIDPRFAQLDARESDELQLDCLSAALDELVEQRRDEALRLIPALQSPYLANDLKSAYDGIRSAGKTIAEVRAMPCPTSPLTRQEMSNLLRGLLANWTGRLTALQQSQHSELLEFAEQLRSAPDLFGLISGWKLNLQRVPNDRRPELKEFRETLKAWIVDQQTAPFRDVVFDVLSRFDALYDERKIAIGALDFNDLERRTIALLRSGPDVQRRIRAQFRQVMLDEFQDINEQQNELIDLIRSDDVFFAVGDSNQSIYGFRHARPEIFHQYRDAIRKDEKHYSQLLDNFRSRAEILRCVEAVLNGEEGIDTRALTAAAEFAPKAQPSIEILRVQTSAEEEAGEREAAWIAHRILDLREKNDFEFRDYAVLCRNGDSMRPILEAFGRAGIPYVCGRRQSFLLAREGLDITALLHTIANPRDGIALATVLRSDLVGVSDEALLRLRLLAGSLTGGLNTAAFDSAKLAEFAPDDAAKLARFAAGLKRWRAEQPVIPLDLLIARALGDCGLEVNENIESFLNLARTRGERKNLIHFLHEIESLQKAISTESDLSDEDQGNCVQVMTAHAAKGLEFPVTIIAAMEKGTQRTSAPVTFTPAYGLGLKWNDPSSKDGIEDSWQQRNSEYLKLREKEESNRLLYVAMTRAKEHLILSYSVGERKPSNWARLLETKPPAGFTAIDTSGAIPLLTSNHTASERESPVLIAKPVITEQHDSAVNVTSLALFAQCARKYYIQRYIGWTGGRVRAFDPEEALEDRTEDGGDETPAAELGSFVHEILAGKTADYPSQAHDLANVFLQSPLGREAANAARIAREWDFIVDIDGMLVRGTIDLWFETDGKICIVDYKTDDLTAAEAALRAADYAPQLALYALALERALGPRPATAYLHFLRPGSALAIPVDDSALSEVRSLIARIKEAQNGLKFDLNEGPHCRSCQFYRGLCPAPL